MTKSYSGVSIDIHMAIMAAVLHDKSIMSQNDCVLQNDASKQNSEFMELGHRYIYIY